jgi:hypothetical protein
MLVDVDLAGNVELNMNLDLSETDHCDQPRGLVSFEMELANKA